MVSCQRRGIDPLKYLRDVLTRLPAMTTADDLDQLTPACSKPAALRRCTNRHHRFVSMVTIAT